MKKLITVFTFLVVTSIYAQNTMSYWQQHVDYTMKVDMNVDNYKYTGDQTLVYQNNSPDTLTQVFYHLYFNAFQPGSEMDVRSRTIEDPDSRVMDRISKLKPDEVGYLKISNLKQDGKKVETKTVGTILQVQLAKPLLPGDKTTFKLHFDGQVPVQVRRAGRNNAEGISLSMSQWYPKMAEYDFEGWHADAYIAREFHQVWGNFDVKITIDKDYMVGGTGYLQNPNEIGYGYEKEGSKVKRKGKKLTWHFKAPKVLDFTWAADPDYVHDKVVADDGTTLNFLYKDKPSVEKNWKKLEPKAEAMYNFFNKHIGQYPYKQYSFIQGGDGGMEYSMCTLINGDKDYGSLEGTAAHEFAHSWFQHLLASNESEHEWMDEGFTTYISTKALNELSDSPKENPYENAYKGYIYLANSGKEKPQTTHADRYATNRSYGLAAYSKGAVFLAQLEYVVGEENVAKILKRYFDEWKFKHPTPNDFIRVAEKVSGAQLGWYLRDFTETTNTIDYAVNNIAENDGKTVISMERKGLMPMPLDVKVTYTDGSSEMHYIPLRMMYWSKPNAGTVEKDWPWALPTYELTLDKSKSMIEKVEIDPSQLMADVDRENNIYTK